MLYLWSIFFFALLQLAQTSLIAETTALTEGTTTLPLTTTADDDELPPLLPTSTAKLVRQRRQPPITIVRHYIRASKRTKPRRRVKRPKIRYGPPNYSYSEPITYYKPKRPPITIEHPSISLGDFEHFNINSADFDLPSHSYETQSMDLDFYNHGGNTYEEHPAPVPSEEYSYDNEHVAPSYSYAPSKPKVSPPRIPHTKYGVPEIYHDYSSSYSSSSSDGSEGSYHTSDSAYHYSTDDGGKYGASHAPSDSDKYAEHSYETIPSYSSKEEHQPPAPPEVVHRPAVQYGASASNIPETYAPPAIHTSYHQAVDDQDNYSVYDKKLLNSGYSDQHSFAEPPASHGKGIEVSYSPAYEINLSSSKGHQPSNSYQPPLAEPHPGNFAEPPPSHAPPPPEEHPAQQPTHSQKYPNTAVDYLPPSHELPLNTHHMQPAYDFPKSSYEVPIYDPIPFEASNQNEHEFYPPHTREEPRYSEPERVPAASQEDTQYENQQQHLEIEDDHEQEHAADDVHPSGSSTSSTTGHHARKRRVRRKRKRVRGNSSTSTTKHILDVPELQEAFEADHRYKHEKHVASTDTDANESNESNYIVKHTRHHHASASTESPTSYANDNYDFQSGWNPMRIHTSSRSLATATTTLATHEPTAIPPTSRTRQRPQAYRPQQKRFPKHTTEDTATSVADLDGEKIAIISIEKSRSKSYYDGTIAPPISPVNMYKSRNSRVNTTPTRSATAQTSAQDVTRHTTKRTTKSIFDTTYFKSPRSNKELELKLSALAENLPKNHKPYY